MAELSLPPRSGLARLPKSVMDLICDPLDWHTIRQLRLCCKHLNDAIADSMSFYFHTVSILVNTAGMQLLSGIAAGPLAKHVRHVVISRQIAQDMPNQPEQPERLEALALLGLSSQDADTVPQGQRGPTGGLDTPFAHQLAAALSGLPSLEEVRIGSGDVFYSPRREVTVQPPGFKDALKGPVTSPFPSRRRAYHVSEDEDDRVIKAIFRGVLFAAAQEHATRSHIKSFKVEEARLRRLSRDAFTFTDDQRQLLAPLLSQLKTLHIESEAMEDDNGEQLTNFIGMCTSLTELFVDGDPTQTDRHALLRLTEGLVPQLPHLEVLGLQCMAFPPAGLIKLLSHWQLQEVYLDAISLKQDTLLARNHAKKCKKWVGYPVLWDAVLRAVSDHGTTATRLGLRHLKQFHEDGEQGDMRDVEFEPSSFKGVGKPLIIVTNGDGDLDGAIGNGAEDVFSRAAAKLKTPQDAFPAPPETSTTQPRLALLPVEVLDRICEDLQMQTISQIRLVCKSLAAALAPVAASTLRTVSIVASPIGMAALADIASSAFGPHVRYVEIATDVAEFEPDYDVTPERSEQFAFLGLDPVPFTTPFTRHDLPCPGPDTPFAREIAKVLSTFLALEGAGVGSGLVPITRRPDIFGSRSPQHRGPYGLRELENVEDGQDARVINILFRGVVFALGHAHAAGATAMTLRIDYGEDDSSTDCDDDQSQSPVGLDDSAFSFGPAECELVAPFLGGLRTLKLTRNPYWDLTYEDGHSDGFKTFIRMCTGLVELELQGVKTLSQGDDLSVPQTQAANTKGSTMPRWMENLVEAPAPPLPRLEVLALSRLTLPYSVLIQLISQWPLREVSLNSVTLREDTNAAPPSGSTSREVPRLWDRVFRALSRDGTHVTRKLHLDNLMEAHGDLDEATHRVDFECGCTGGPTFHPANVATFAAERRVVLRYCREADTVEAEGFERDVFIRAADLLQKPKAFETVAEGDDD